MVNGLEPLVNFSAPLGRLLAQADGQTEPLLKRLEPAVRAKVVMALLALALVGMALVTLAWLGARYFRRIARKPLGTSGPRQEDWYRKPLVPQQPSSPGASEDE